MLVVLSWPSLHVVSLRATCSIRVASFLRPSVEMVWSKSQQQHCYGLLTIEPPEMYEEEEQQGGADEPLTGNLLRPLELPQIRWHAFDANDHTIDDIRFVR